MSSIDQVDRDATLAKYRAERDKRLREDGNDQYVEVTGQFAHYLDDPYTERVEREPCSTRCTVAFIGGGFAGLVTGRPAEGGRRRRRPHHREGRRLRRHLVLEPLPGRPVRHPRRSSTCRCSRRPATCRPRSTRTAPRSSSTAGASAVTSASTTTPCSTPRSPTIAWDAEASRWIIRTNRGDEMRARYLVMGTGPLHRPKLPGIPGIEDFAGHSFHTSRWDYDYTGGDPEGAPLTSSGRQAGGDHRHRRHVGAVHPAPGPGVSGAVRLPAHAVDDRRPRQRAHRPRVVRPRGAQAGLAAGVAG